ncbi:phosphatidylglycerophosphatase A [Methanothermobacter tenebrarum]|uniref:Alpha-ribazole phosphatase CobZ n=1 Tax=Methanothermobacter tenebrarum TaxID=680118 RepID=A0A328PI27_9EURY|nr:phosphatidylglycerophosphatase A [Methanothermobacter tenebrarum]MBC7101188.1 phosphatidylglycerophosphatase A [Methanobacteriales archaeon]NPV65131.1 alpha-ribazole phosphatase CobZ [Methanobacteriaceae archaeon]RAO79505.1 alpha-ribazole phosphatase CobZ [Methanothermobacter tenebrarum]
MQIVKGETSIQYNKNKLTIKNSHGLKTLEVCETKSGFHETKKITYPSNDMGASADNFKLLLKDFENITCSIGIGNSLLDLIIFIDDNKSLEELLSYLKIVVETKDKILGPLTRFYKSKTILIISREGQPGNCNTKKLKNCIKTSLLETLKDNNISILDQLREKGILLDELVEAGLKLCIGVEIDNKLKEKLKRQLIKSLSDINVISLILAAIRAEEDLQYHRIKNVNIDDDPAHLYADEVLGMAVANQIAGTKAIFNFKRYDEEKPGIISRLGPMTDDVIAGLIAGSMSKIFEE